MPNTDKQIKQQVEQIKEKFTKRIEEIREKGAERIKQINEDAPDPSNVEAALNFTFDVKWENTSLKFDIPKFTIEREVLKFDIPEVKMETEEIKFDVPSTRMVNKCVAKKPEFYGFPPKIKWTCIYTKFPEVYMKRISIKTDVPKFNSKTVEIKFDKPVVEMETLEIKLKLPQFYLKETDAEIEAHSREIEGVAVEMTSDISEARTEMKAMLHSEVANEIDLMFDGLREEILKERNNVSKSYEEVISKTKSTIKTLKENNANKQVNNLENELSKIVDEYINVLRDFDNSLGVLNKQEEKALKNLNIG